MKNPSELRRHRLSAIANAHAQWEAKHLPSALLSSQQNGDDYNMHHLDVDASPEQEIAFHKLVKKSKQR